MGFSSWLTCDTKESIMKKYPNECKKVYFYTPDEVFSGFYDGYGRIDGIEVYTYMAIYNGHGSLTELDDPDKAEKLRCKGIGLYFDWEDGKIELDYVLKFSFDPDCDWSKHEGSKSCPRQGYWPDNDDDFDEMVLA